jgi:hypothetical protein
MTTLVIVAVVIVALLMFPWRSFRKLKQQRNAIEQFKKARENLWK